jgi:hypothetical protein
MRLTGCEHATSIDAPGMSVACPRDQLDIVRDLDLDSVVGVKVVQVVRYERLGSHG